MQQRPKKRRKWLHSIILTLMIGGALFPVVSAAQILPMAIWGEEATLNTQTSPSALALNHSVRSRSFTVSWTAGTGNGGAGGCKLQYLRNDTTWTDLSGTYNCDATTTNVSANLPSTDNWTNNFNGTGVQIRLALTTNSAAQGVFPQRTTCTTTGGSGSPTPTIDENCNAIWDDGVTNNWYSRDFAGFCDGNYSGSMSIGGAYTCNPPASCSGSTDLEFDAVFWNYTGFGQSWLNSTCGGAPFYSGYSSFANAGSLSPSGGVPPSSNPSMNGVCSWYDMGAYAIINSATYTGSRCRYRYYTSTSHSSTIYY